jgi:hypothetical protein
MARGFLDEYRRRDHENDEPVQFDGAVVQHATQLALKVLLPGGKTLWVPQAVITEDSEVYALGHSGRLEVKGWWARKEGLE